jgi:hypothetical protein
MRKQYHFRPIGNDTIIWDIDRLVNLSREFPRIWVPLSSIRELDEPYWQSADEPHPTCRSMIEHTQLINEADLSFPIILSSDGRVMDGMHRVAKALVEGRAEIEAVKFERDPEPDYLNKHPSELPY